MSDTIKATFIIMVGLALAAILHGGIYQIVSASAGSGGSNDFSGDTAIWSYRLNRFTGEVLPFTKMYRVPAREPNSSK